MKEVWPGACQLEILLRKALNCICISHIQIERPFAINEFVHPACLPSKPSKIGQKCYASGWGDIDCYHWITQVEELMFAQLTILDSDGCFTKLRTAIFDFCEKFDERKLYNQSLRWDLCTYENDKSICPGDLGGPFICDEDGKAVVHGIASSTSIRRGISGLIFSSEYN